MTDDDKLQTAFTRRLRDEGHPDPATLANELIVMARGHGWRPVEALQPPPEVSRSTGPNEEWRRRKAELATRTECR